MGKWPKSFLILLWIILLFVITTMAKFDFRSFSKEAFLIGASYSIYNSFDLYNDGILLLIHGRLPRAYTLFQLSMEEAGKVVLLLDAFTIKQVYENSDDKFRKTMPFNNFNERFSKTFTDHSEKTKYAMMYEKKFMHLFSLSMNPNNSRAFEFKVDEVEIKALNATKNQSLYTSIDSDRFILPKDKITPEHVKNIRWKAHTKVALTKASSVRFLKERKIPSEIDLNKLEALTLFSESTFYP